MAIYTISRGEHSDYEVVAVLEGPDGLDLPALFEEYRRRKRAEEERSYNYWWDWENVEAFLKWLRWKGHKVAVAETHSLHLPGR